MSNQLRVSYLNGAAGLRKLPTFADVTKNGVNNTRNQYGRNNNSFRKDANSGNNMPRGSRPESSLSKSTTTSTSYEWRVQERRGKRSKVSLAQNYSSPRPDTYSSYATVQNTYNQRTGRNENGRMNWRASASPVRSSEGGRNTRLNDFITQKPQVGAIFTQRTTDYYQKAYGKSENAIWSEVVKGTNQGSPNSSFNTLNTGSGSGSGTGYGSGSGTGNGSGSGTGSGTGSGIDSGTGSGTCSAKSSGNGSEISSGAGSAIGSGNGSEISSGTGSGTCSGTGSGTCSGTGSGSVTGNGIRTGSGTNFNGEPNEKGSQCKRLKRVPKNKYKDKNKSKFNKAVENSESKNSFGTNNPEHKKPFESSGLPQTYTFGDFDRNEVASNNNSMVVIRTPRRPPDSAEKLKNTNTDQSVDKTKSTGSAKIAGGGGERLTLEERLEQQILNLKAQNLTVNQLYIVDLMEDLLLKYQDDVYGRNESLSRCNGFSNSYIRNEHMESGNVNDPVAERSSTFPRQKISNATVILETVEEKRQRNRRARIARQSLMNRKSTDVGLEHRQGHSGGYINVVEDESQEDDSGVLLDTNADVDEAAYAQRWNHIDECGNIVVGTVNPEYRSECESMEITEIFRKSGKREASLEDRINKKN